MYAYWITVNYREAYNIFACNGILFNHESPIRGETFVTRKITRGLARISEGLDECIFLGNIDAKRDWGHAKDFVKAMWLMLQQETPNDYVISTGRQISVREFIEIAGKNFGMNIIWDGQDLNEVGIDQNNGKVIIKIDKRYFRPAEVETLLGNSDKAKKDLGWEPTISLEQLIKEMTDYDAKEVKKEILLHNEGFNYRSLF